MFLMRIVCEILMLLGNSIWKMSLNMKLLSNDLSNKVHLLKKYKELCVMFKV